MQLQASLGLFATSLLTSLALTHLASCGGVAAGRTTGSLESDAGKEASTGGKRIEGTGGRAPGTGGSASVQHPTGTGGVPEAGAPDARPPEQPAACVISSESTIPGLHIEFLKQPCAFTLVQASRGIRFSYDVVIDDDVPGYSSRYSSSGVLMYPGGDVAKLQIATVIEGGTSRYCVCDQGGPQPFCTLQDGGFTYEASTPAEPCAPVTLEKGASHVTWPSLAWEGPIDWHGRSWEGPSDTGNPEGAPFPPGDYELKVTIAGRLSRDGGMVDVDASARFLVRLVP